MFELYYSLRKYKLANIIVGEIKLAKDAIICLNFIQAMMEHSTRVVLSHVMFLLLFFKSQTYTDIDFKSANLIYMW